VRALAAIVVCAGVLVAGRLAGARCEASGPAWLEGRVAGSGGAARRVLEARLGEKIEVAVAFAGRLDGRKLVFGHGPGRVAWPEACGALTVTWRTVEPRMQHTRTPAPNGEIRVYANAVIFGPEHGRWIGWDRLEYFETTLPGGGPLRVLDDARASPASAAARPAPYDRLGTQRLAATVEAGGQRLTTPGAEDAPDGQIADRVFRYSFRSRDDFLGWLTSFFNVPYLFGSGGQGRRNQAERYVGGDCADLLVAALRRAGHRLDYSSVAGLVSRLRRASAVSELRPCAAPVKLAPIGGDGRAAPAAPACATAVTPLVFGKDVRPGDLLALDYVGFAGLPRDWDHIVAVVEDRGPDGVADGVLGADDIVADSGDALGLKLAPLGEQGAVRLQVLRP
jgi:hypothetical protein